MRPAGRHLRKHRVLLRATLHPEDGPAYAGLDGAGGEAVEIAARIQPGTAARTSGVGGASGEATVGDQPAEAPSKTVYVSENPVLTDPLGRTVDEDGLPRQLRLGDAVSILVPAGDDSLYTALGAMEPGKTGRDGEPVEWRFGIQAVR